MPNNLGAAFQVRNIRYVYDNPVSSKSFDAAHPLEATKGTGDLVTAPLDTRSATSVVELSNTTNSTIKVSLKIYKAAGGKAVYDVQVKLKPYASYHIIADQLLKSSTGIVTADSNTPGSLIATVMQYGRSASLGINYTYGIQARPPLGTVLRGSYNTYLEQGCILQIVNSSATANKVNIGMVRYDGTKPVTDYERSVPAHGMIEENLCGKDRADVYGVTTLQPETPNTLHAAIVRLGKGDSYRFSTEVRQ